MNLAGASLATFEVKFQVSITSRSEIHNCHSLLTERGPP